MIGSLSGGVSMPALAAYKLYLSRGDQQLEVVRNDRRVQGEIEYFTKQIKKVKDVEDFLDDKRLVDFAMTAFGLQNERHMTGLIKRVFRESIDDERSAVNQLPDKRWLSMATEFGFGDNGTFKLSLSTFAPDMADKYVEGVHKAQIEEQSPALSAALYFKKEAGSINNTYQILASPTLRELFTVAFNLPRQMALQELTTQVAYIEDRVDLESFKDPDKVEKLIERFLVAADGGYSQSSGINVGSLLSVVT